MEAIQNAKETTVFDLGALLDACDDAVVTLVAGDTRLVAHRALLMDRSPVFSAMFRHDTLECNSRQVDIMDVEGPVLRQQLSYLYTLRARQLPDIFVPATGSSRQVLGGQSQGVALRRKITTMETILAATKTRAVDLGALLDACEDAMVTLVAGDTRLVAHRAVLMDTSPVFAAMFRHDTLECRSGQVTILDVEGPVLRQLLSYLYTLRAPQLPGMHMVTQLLVAADKYGVDSLKVACEKQVATKLSVETAAAAAVVAVRYSCESLRRASITFLMDDTLQVMASRGWADAMRSQPEDLIEVKRLLVAKIRGLPAWEKSRRLREAAMEGAVGELEVLLAAGAEVVAGTVDGMNALHWAAAAGHVEVVRRLVAHGVPVNSMDRGQYTPLHYAALFGHAPVVQLLLANSADHSARDVTHRTTPLHWAVEKGNTEIAAALLEAGAYRAPRNSNGETPLDLARKFNHQQLVDLLTGT